MRTTCDLDAAVITTQRHTEGWPRRARARLSRRASSSPVASLGAGLSRPRFVPIATATASRANRVFPPIDADADAESRRLPGVSAFANDLESRRGARMDFTLDAGERAGSSGAPPPR